MPAALRADGYRVQAAAPAGRRWTVAVLAR
jgi:hypothetical protein